MSYTERKRNSRKKKFDLDDEEDPHEMKLTHMGREIGDDNENDSKHFKKHQDDENEFLDDRIVEKLHFGGKEIESDSEEELFKVKKTKEEVFREIVAKSKLHKAMRAEIKDQNEELIQQLDDDFADIFPLLETRAKQRKEKSQDQIQTSNLSLLEISKKQNDKIVSKKSEARKRDQKFVRKADMNTDYNYDALAFELKDSARARPELLIKSEKEKAIDRKDELERLDREKNTNKNNKAEQLDEENEESEPEEEKRDLEQMNHDLVDLIENEYEESEEEPDEFEAIDEDDSDDE